VHGTSVSSSVSDLGGAIKLERAVGEANYVICIRPCISSDLLIAATYIEASSLWRIRCLEPADSRGASERNCAIVPNAKRPPEFRSVELLIIF
jgi:hypothetical protein